MRVAKSRRWAIVSKTTRESTQNRDHRVSITPTLADDTFRSSQTDGVRLRRRTSALHRNARTLVRLVRTRASGQLLRPGAVCLPVGGAVCTGRQRLWLASLMPRSNQHQMYFATRLKSASAAVLFERAASAEARRGRCNSGSRDRDT